MNGSGSEVGGVAARAGDDGPLSPRDALTLVEEQSQLVSRRLGGNVSLILAGWGVAWLAGFGVAWLAASKTAAVPAWLVAVVIAVVNVVAAGLSYGQMIKSGRGIEGPSRDVMSMYAWAWPLALAGVFATDVALVHQGLPGRLAPLVWTGSSVGIVGVLYLASGMLFRDRVNYGLGVWMLVIGAASVSAGTPANFAVLALAGGGGFLAAAVRFAWAGRRSVA